MSSDEGDDVGGNSAKRGWLNKQSKNEMSIMWGGGGAKWNKRYFVLAGGSLFYYKKETDANSRGSFALHRCSVVKEVRVVGGVVQLRGAAPRDKTHTHDDQCHTLPSRTLLPTRCARWCFRYSRSTGGRRGLCYALHAPCVPPAVLRFGLLRPSTDSSTMHTLGKQEEWSVPSLVTLRPRHREFGARAILRRLVTRQL